MHGFVIILSLNEVLNWKERDPICINSMGNHEAAGAFSEHKNSSCSSSISLSNQSNELAVSRLVLPGTQYRDLQLEHCAEGETAHYVQATSVILVTWRLDMPAAGYAKGGAGTWAQSALPGSIQLWQPRLTACFLRAPPHGDETLELHTAM